VQKHAVHKYYRQLEMFICFCDRIFLRKIGTDDNNLYVCRREPILVQSCKLFENYYSNKVFNNTFFFIRIQNQNIRNFF